MTGPHQGREPVTAGAPVAAAEAAAVLLHGRGGTADGMVRTADEFYRHGLALVAPRAQYDRWYPHSFLAPTERNEPHLSSALRAVDDALADLAEAGVPRDRSVIVGFSQGACVAAEFAARNPTRYGGVAVLSGGLVGPPETAREYDGSLDGTPVYVECSEDDPHVPLERVRETVATFESLDGDVTERIVTGDEHAITDDGIAAVSELVAGVLGTDGSGAAPDSDAE